MVYTNINQLQLPEKVYKYRDYTNLSHRRILSNREIYFASPREFEDPNDCKNVVRYDLLSESEYKEYSSRKREEFYPDANRIERRRLDRIAMERFYNKSYLNQAKEDYNFLCDHVGILCLTSYRDNDSMWDRYSNHSTGFCVGFYSKILFSDDEHFGGGGPVTYDQTLPIIHPNDSYELRYSKLIFGKLNKWEFEKEYRLHKTRYNIYTSEQRKATVPVQAYAEIILGYAMQLPEKLEILGILTAQFPNISVLQAKKSGNGISFENANPSDDLL